MNWRTTAPLIAGAIMVAGGVTNGWARAVTTETHIIRRVVLEAGNLGKTIPEGYTTIQHKDIWCGYSTCTFALSIMANVGEATCKDEWAIVGLVDGNSVDGGPLLEALPNAGSTQTHTWQGIYVTNEGYHNVAFELYVPCAVNANQWSVRYLVTSP